MSKFTALQPVWLTVQSKLALARQYWQALGRRDQLALSVLGALLVLMFLWLLLLRPAIRDLALAKQELPRLQYEMAQLQTVLSQIQVLDKELVVPVDGQGQDKALQRSLQTLGTQCQTEQSPAEQRVLVCQAVAAPALIDWLMHAPRVLGFAVQEVSMSRSVVDSRERAGLLDGRIVLRAGEPS
ncbi:MULTISPECIES: type II secretion system protein M [Alcaligenes]|uniref:type II secretion system protein M n=1 Tax=Alcaligenes TaxID=507 RepID=UPI0021503B27|nr:MULTISPECIES: type II secretion system protein M [Alcaligenes]MCR4145071.1 type II secretion system protein M [Alcaligenes faecalis]